MEMTPRERLIATVRFETLDRPVRWEALSFWKETLKRWHGEGLAEEVKDELSAHVAAGFDLQMPIFLGENLHAGFDPLFTEEILEQDAVHTVKRDFSGSVVKVFTDGSSTPPHFLDFPVKDRPSWEEVKPRLDPDTPGRLAVWAPFIQMAKRPDKIRAEGTFQGLTFVQTYNGKEGWNLNPFTGVTDPQPFSEDDLKSMRYQADLDGMLWNWKEKGHTVTSDGKEDIEGTSCYKIKLVTKEGDTFTYYIDSDSYVLIRSNSKIKVMGNETESDNYYSNYMQVDGIAVPGKSETRMNGQLAVTIIVEKVDLNTELADTLFEKPVK